MNIKLQRTLRVTLFLILFCLIFAYTNGVLTPKTPVNIASINTFYHQPENSIDVLFIGPSTFQWGISPFTMWEKYGFTSYVRASGNQFPVVTYYYLLEALQYQHPKVVVLDGKALFTEYSMDKLEGQLRNTIDPLRLSFQKIQLIYEVVAQSKFQTFMSYLFPIARYHNRWKVLTENDFSNSMLAQNNYAKGVFLTFRNKPVVLSADRMKPTEKTIDLQKAPLYYYEKAIQRCKENNIQVVLLALPRRDWNYSRYIALKQFSEEYNLDFIDYNQSDLINATHYDPSTDFQDNIHLNFYGTEKIAAHLGAYLQNKYDLPDRRDDPAYQQWNLDLKVFKINMEQAKSEE